MAKCPVCKEELNRVRRKQIDRLISFLIPLRRYQCINPHCRWHGVRVHWADFGKWGKRKPSKTKGSPSR